VLLLDTHVWIWSVAGDTRRIGRRARQRLARTQSTHKIFVSPVSLFEVTALHTAGRLRLTRSPEQWIRGALDETGIRVAELVPDMAIDAGTITRGALADPLDRLLVATARHMDAALMTGDAQILAYAAATGAVRIADAGT
jgi:PIN domain nuclease of toxin-antitoxin system